MVLIGRYRNWKFWNQTNEYSTEINQLFENISWNESEHFTTASFEYYLQISNLFLLNIFTFHLCIIKHSKEKVACINNNITSINSELWDFCHCILLLLKIDSLYLLKLVRAASSRNRMECYTDEFNIFAIQIDKSIKIISIKNKLKRLMF